MPFDISTFREALKTGGVRPNLFEVHLSFPEFSGITGVDQDFSLLCKSAQLPGQDIGTIEVGYFGRKIKVAGDRTFAEWTITVINDENFKIRNAFEKWHNALNQHYANVRSAAADTLDKYQMAATVYQFGKKGGAAIKVYDFVGMYPSSVQPVDLAWDTTDTIEEFQVTLQYQWWEASTTDGPHVVALGSVAV